ncbi:hypothetical protein K438DRAFT_1968991 [Mycena galopus ATCC 62051]|nr:hypothetical protein K438DRAFT_1968991 [Mycena galopus ATCC 62051]
MPATNKRIVQSPKNVFYLRPDVGSRWLGPTDDRVWVPALDWPEGLSPPDDPEATTTAGARTPRAPDTTDSAQAPQYASVASRDPPAYQGPQHRNHGAFTRAFGPLPPFRSAPPPVSIREPDPRARTHRAYTGPFTNTMRQRDVELARRQEEVGRRDDERRRRDEGGVRRHKGSTYRGDHLAEYARATPGGPDRAREHHLRERALHSRAPTGAKAKVLPTRPVPDVDRALRRPDGHPIPPVGAAADDDESDYGSSGAEDESEIQKFRTREHDRMAKAIGKKGGAPVSDALLGAPRDAGLWGDLSVDDIPGARNLVWWWSHGCPRACAYGKFIMSVYGNEQLRRRSDGVQYILRHAHAANQGYLGAATGDSTPISRRDPNTVPRQVRRKWAKERLRREDARMETSGTPTTESSIDYDEAMPPAVAPNPVPAEPFVQSYSGSSPIPPLGPDAMTTHRLGPQMSLHEAMAHAATERPSEWVRGMRTAAGEWPTEHTPAGTFPMSSDLRAARLLHFLAPVNRAATHRTAWMESVLRGFSVWGLFERHVQLGEWIHAEHGLEHYPFDATNITYSQSMQWVHSHGVDRGSVAAQELHAFATSWRNLHEGLPTTTGERFSGHDIEHQESVLRWDVGCISRWATLWHGPVCGGVISLADRCPADGVRRAQQEARRAGPTEDTDMTDVGPPRGAPQTAPQLAPEDGEISGGGAPEAPEGDSAPPAGGSSD